MTEHHCERIRAAGFGFALNAAMFLLAAALAALSPRPAAAQRAVDPVKIGTLVSGKSLGVAVAKNPQLFRAKLKKLAERFNLTALGPLILFDEDQFPAEGVDLQRPFLVQIYPADIGATWIAAVPFTDEKKFLTQFEESGEQEGFKLLKHNAHEVTALYAKKGKYAFLGDPQHAEAFKAFLADQSRADELFKPLEDWIAKNDVAILALKPGIHKAMAVFRKSFAEGVKEILARLPFPNKEQFEKHLTEICDEIFIAIQKESEILAAAVNIDDAQNVRLTLRSLHTPEGRLTRWSMAAPNSPAVGFKNLPAGPTLFACEFGMPPGLIEDLTESIAKLTPWAVAEQARGQVPPELADKLNARLKKSSKNIRGFTVYQGELQSDERLFDRTLEIYDVADSKKFLELTIEESKLKNEMSQAKSGTDTTEVKETEFQGKPALVVSTDLLGDLREQILNSPEPEAVRKMMERFWGLEAKLTIQVVAWDEHTVLQSYNETLLTDVTREFSKPTTSLLEDLEFAETFKLLPAKRQGTMLVNVPAIVNSLQRVVYSIAGDIMPGKLPPAPPEFGAAPPIGMSLRAAPNAVEMQLVIPGEFIVSAAEYGQSIFLWSQGLQNR